MLAFRTGLDLLINLVKLTVLLVLDDDDDDGSIFFLRFRVEDLVLGSVEELVGEEAIANGDVGDRLVIAFIGFLKHESLFKESFRLDRLRLSNMLHRLEFPFDLNFENPLTRFL